MKYTKEAISKKMEKDNKIRLIFKIIIYIIIMPIIVYNIYIILFWSINKTETPSFFGVKTYVIASGSMEPTIKIGDVIITKKCSQNKLNVGDIISFKYGDTIITHRINSIENTPQGIRYITKGDNNNSVDTDKVEFSDIQGKYVNKIGLAGKLLIFLKSRTAIILVVFVILLLYIHEIKVNRKLEVRERKRKRHNWEVRQSNYNERKVRK